MHIKRLMECITQIDNKYLELISCAINETMQEIIDIEHFHDHGPRAISTDELLIQITNSINEYTAEMFMTCILEFCITNYYPFEQEEWNFINYFLEFHKSTLTLKERRYLNALNNSYMSIYKVTSVTAGQFIILEDQIDLELPNITVFDRSLSKNITEGTYIATRIVQKQATKSELSSSIIPMPKAIINNCINAILNITNLMSNNLVIKSLSGGEEIEDNDTNRLLIKKMWVKEILESIYLYYTNPQDYHDILDYDGNPWNPCIIEFDINTSALKIKNVLSSVKEFTLDQGYKNSNNWLWLGKRYKSLDPAGFKEHIPDVNSHGKEPLFNGLFITNEYDGESYHIFAEIKLIKKKLLVHVHSYQRANIAQDKIQTILQDMVSNATIYPEHDIRSGHNLFNIKTANSLN